MVKNIICCCCEKKFDYSCARGTGQQLFGGVYACQECCDKLAIKKGLKGAFKASTYDAVKFNKKYNILTGKTDTTSLDRAIKNKEIKKQEFKSEMSEIKRKKAIEHSRYKKKQEEEYICKKCGSQWYFGEYDKLKNIHNATTLNHYTINQLKNPSQCPKCGSSQSTHRKVEYWVDKNGNVVD